MAKSVAKNAVFNGIRTIAYMAFPLITYPYITRVLMAENIGKIDFVTSVVSYFTLIAGLGISSYAIRDGARRRENQKELDQFASEVFTINCVSTLVAYTLLALLLLLWPQLQDYTLLVGIQSLTIIGTTLSVDWVYGIFEDYGYITARTLVVQTISTALLFLLVKKPSDYLIYAGIVVFSNIGANIFNFFHARTHTHIRLTWNFDFLQHLRPMMVLFGNTLATTVYVNTDVTLLGIFRDDYEIGIYGIAVRVYTIIKQLLNSLVTVSLPRLSLYAASEDKSAYNNLLESVAHALAIVVIPLISMLFFMADDVVLIVGGPEFTSSALPLRTLCFAAVPAVFACFTTNAILLPHKAEHLVLRSTICGAIVNFALNLVVIPFFGLEGAAVSTALAEAVVLAVSTFYARSFCNMHEILEKLAAPALTSVLCVAAITGAFFLTTAGRDFTIVRFLVSGASLFLAYALMLALRKDELFFNAVSSIRSRLIPHSNE